MKVMFIDDDPLILRMAGFIMKKSGFEAVTAGSGAEGVELMKSERPEMVFIDVEMPGMNGFETLEAMKSTLDELPRVWMMSGTVTEEVKDRAEAAGAEGVAGKPLDASELTSIIGGR